MALRAEGIPSGTILNQGIPDRHIYCNWSDILTQRAAVEPGCSYQCPRYAGRGGTVSYAPDMCPRSLDLLQRALHLQMNPLLTDDDCRSIAHGINKVTAQVR